ncbi:MULTISPECIES: winged helix-turn-helix domain-containing protein [Streptosporangiaceae]|uniref:winged helix-turn-helix domain-containing protein n=1 Tax=Streptosporangiaceae TaxID=2004 RepID=UPI0033FE9709
MIEFDPDRTVWAQVYDLLRERIEGGVYKERHPIPSIAHLEQELGIARQTVRKVIGKLADDGLVRVIGGKGTFVRPQEDWQQPEEK